MSAQLSLQLETQFKRAVRGGTALALAAWLTGCSSECYQVHVEYSGDQRPVVGAEVELRYAISYVPTWRHRGMTDSGGDVTICADIDGPIIVEVRCAEWHCDWMLPSETAQRGFVLVSQAKVTQGAGPEIQLTISSGTRDEPPARTDQSSMMEQPR